MKILVVDDEEDVREIITDFIVENFDIDVLQASTGMEAINCIEGEKDIGLIIADYNFPDLGDGGVNGGGIYTFNLGNQNIPFFLFLDILLVIIRIGIKHGETLLQKKIMML